MCACVCVGYVQLHQDLFESTAKIEKAISSLKKDVVDVNTSLRSRIAMLEEEVAVLKAKN